MKRREEGHRVHIKMMCITENLFSIINIEKDLKTFQNLSNIKSWVLSGDNEGTLL
jgi:hypothetical protein